jgi:predicted aspartyl protease
LTLTGQGILTELRSEIQITEPTFNPIITDPSGLPVFQAIWDTGASGSVITQKVVDALGISPVGMTMVHGANSSTNSNVYLVSLLLPSHVIVRTRVTLASLVGVDALIGMDVIAMGDFHISNVKGITVMSFRTPSQHKVDYVQEYADFQRAQANPPKGHRPNPKKRDRR